MQIVIIDSFMKSLFLLFSLTQTRTPQHKNRIAEDQSGAYPSAEYDDAKWILMHTPGEELFSGVIHPAAALFEHYFNVEAAAKEHKNYINILKNNGCQVVTIREILNELDINLLRILAAHALTYVSKNDEYRREILNQMSREDLIRCILMRPTVTTQATDNNTGVEAVYTYQPLMNLYFLRDQSITTPKGTIMCRMNSSQRAYEVSVVKACHEYLGNMPIHEIHEENAFLEGGDYIPFGDVAFLGRGMRTTQEAVNELLNNDLIGHDTLVVVNDNLRWQLQMHLDTHFNVIDKDLVTMCQNRYYAKAGDKNFLTCDIYSRKPGESYQLIHKDLDFKQWLLDRGCKIIPINKQDELHYANNFLTIGPRHICAIDNQSPEFANVLKENNVKVDWIPAENLICGYGAAHCMTQVIKRTVK